MPHYLVTGGAGFIGSQVALQLKAKFPGARVMALDNLKRRGSELNLARLKSAGVEFVHGDIRLRQDLAGLRDIGAIVECSAEPSVMAGVNESPEYVVDTNLLGTVNCLELARTQGALFLFLSTSRVYPHPTLNAMHLQEEATRFDFHANAVGVSAEGINEDFPLEGARTLYGTTKLCSELLIEEYAAMYGVKSIVNRCGVIAGPWQMGKVDQGFAVLWVARHFFKQPIAYFGFKGLGKQVRDLLHIEDLCDLLTLQLQSPEKFLGKVFNVGGGRERSVSLLEMTKLCEEITGHRVASKAVVENRAGDVPWYISDAQFVQHVSGWRPKKSLRDIVSDITAWLRAHEVALAPILKG